MPGRPFKGKEGQDLAVRTEPLARNAAVRVGAAHARGQRMLAIGQDMEFDAEFGPRAAVAAFADDGERGRRGQGEDVDLRLVAHRFGQTLLQRRHVDDPGQRIGLERLRVETQVATLVAPDFHAAHGRGLGVVFGPAAHALEQFTRGAVECIGADVARPG